MFHIMRRKRPAMASALSALALSVALASSALTSQALAAGKTISAVMHADLRDARHRRRPPTLSATTATWSTTRCSRSTPSFNVQPQMADVEVSSDKLTYTFMLRDGLKFHDGAPVTAEDCIASLKRWGARDAMGQKLMRFTMEIDAPTPRPSR